jgi:hypothetical protein
MFRKKKKVPKEIVDKLTATCMVAEPMRVHSTVEERHFQR